MSNLYIVDIAFITTMADIDSNIIENALDNLINNLVAAFQTVMDQLLSTIVDTVGGFLGGDLTANPPALVALSLVFIATGSMLGYKISRG